MKRRKYIISGLVQGVWFRSRTKEEAENLSITGFVRNESDGTLYIEAQAMEEDLSWFEDWIQLGPPQARVEKVDTSEIDLIDNEKDFAIK